MAGHSHWAGIKHKKEITDQKRGQIFSKLLAAITAAAKTEPNQDFNPRLRTAVEKAKENKVPADAIERALKRASEINLNLEDFLFEAYGPGGVAILIEAISDSRNRVVQEIKKILNEHSAKWAESGSVQWAFEMTRGDKVIWRPKFPQAISNEDAEKLAVLVEALEEHSDVQRVTTNADPPPIEE